MPSKLSLTQDLLCALWLQIGSLAADQVDLYLRLKFERGMYCWHVFADP